MTIPVSSTAVLPAEESSRSAVSWGAILAGAVAASALTLVLMLVGSGLGLTMISPWSSEGASVTTFAVSTAVWLIIVQWLASALGGYVTGRLRTKWVGVHTDEVFFRDTAHGLMAWAVATLLIAGVLSSAVSSTIGAGVQATATLTAAATAATAAATSDNAPDSNNQLTGYFVDSLLRPADPPTPPATASTDDATAEVSRILVSSAAKGEMSEADKTYLGQLVAARTGLSDADAKARVNSVLKSVEDAKVAAQEAADTARKTSATVALLGALSLFIGAFVAGVGAALGGRQRDDEAVYLVG
ncbi:hypothetical protein QO002_001570 [Pararhizobium capsulatum DSM 1112]|uniref:Uncharacterized protein n=1 Tax=Pararhizobium capsulatum DSM 1112 TaxID=1121113 RepID=A0ABU0BRD4_9HYPH|nr:hypothetical protein [Pararhizobium capsulatum]MDQ0319432.1 hypothetical protein [Pararhizobium capsulatum DSM 1112]